MGAGGITGWFVNWYLGLTPSTHPGADKCIRTQGSPNERVPSQQCCYKGGKLITDGAGAGSVDYNTPSHEASDVDPWMCAMKLDGRTQPNGRLHVGGGAHFRMYEARRPADKGKDCEALTVPAVGASY